MEQLPIHPYDIVMLAVLILAGVFGAWKGMVWQIASLASVGLSVFAAVTFSPQLAPHLSQQEPWNRFLAMLILYAGTSLGVWMVFRMVSGALERIKLKEFDVQMGAAFGLLKGALLCLVITFFAVTLSESARQSILESKSGVLIARGIRHATPVLPEEVRQVIGQYLDQLENQLAPASQSPDGSQSLFSADATEVEETLRNGADAIATVSEAVERVRAALPSANAVTQSIQQASAKQTPALSASPAIRPIAADDRLPARMATGSMAAVEPAVKPAVEPASAIVINQPATATPSVGYANSSGTGGNRKLPAISMPAVSFSSQGAAASPAPLPKTASARSRSWVREGVRWTTPSPPASTEAAN